MEADWKSLIYAGARNFFNEVKRTVAILFVFHAFTCPKIDQISREVLFGGSLFLLSSEDTTSTSLIILSISSGETSDAGRCAVEISFWSIRLVIRRSLAWRKYFSWRGSWQSILGAAADDLPQDRQCPW